MTKDQVLDPAKMEEKFNACNKLLLKQMLAKEKIQFISKAKIQLPSEYQERYKDLIPIYHDSFSKNDQDIG
jgi:hypothetical protein